MDDRADDPISASAGGNADKSAHKATPRRRLNLPDAQSRVGSTPPEVADDDLYQRNAAVYHRVLAEQAKQTKPAKPAKPKRKKRSPRRRLDWRSVTPLLSTHNLEMLAEWDALDAELYDMLVDVTMREHAQTSVLDDPERATRRSDRDQARARALY